MGMVVVEVLSWMLWVVGLRFDDICYYGRWRWGFLWEMFEMVVEGIYENMLLLLMRRDFEVRGFVIVDEIFFYYYVLGLVVLFCLFLEIIFCVLVVVGGVD